MGLPRIRASTLSSCVIAVALSLQHVVRATLHSRKHSLSSCLMYVIALFFATRRWSDLAFIRATLSSCLICAVCVSHTYKVLLTKTTLHSFAQHPPLVPYCTAGACGVCCTIMRSACAAPDVSKLLAALSLVSGEMCPSHQIGGACRGRSLCLMTTDFLQSWQQTI